MKLVGRITNYVFSGKLKGLVRFSLVGVLNTIIDFIVFTMFNSLFGFNYEVSQVAGYSFGIANSFIFNKNWTFQNKNADKKTINEILEFILINLISLTITIIFMRFFIKNFNFNVYAAKIIVTFIAQITNFLGYKLWVFN